MLLAKMDKKWVQIVKFAHRVQFSPDPDWLMIVLDWEKPARKRAQFQWIPATTRFHAVKELID
jgi:hypothetical protein